MNFGRAFSYIFQDQEWFKKILLPALCMLIPIVGWMVALGWALKVTQNLINGTGEPLPDLNFGDDILRGFFAFLISFVYSLPVSLISSLSGWIGNWSWFGSDTGWIVSGFVGGILGILSLLLGIIGSFLSLGGIANFLLNNDFGAAFRLKEVIDLLKSNFGDWVIVVLGTLLAVGVIGPLGTAACVVGVVLTLTYGLVVTAHLLGQATVCSQKK